MSVKIKDYSPELLKLYLGEKKRLVSLLPKSVIIEHIGSSAVGIGGKNIIDILIGVPSKNDIKAVCDILTKNGYYAGNNAHQDRIFLASKKEETGEGDFHIHICATEGETYKDFITLRNYLKNNKMEALKYQNKKREFAQQAGFDREKYKELKSIYVSKLMARAKKQPQ